MVRQSRQPAYQGDLADFCSFVGLTGADKFRTVTRAYVLAWRAQLEQCGLTGATIRRKLAALASLFDNLLESNAVASSNPGHAIKQPKIDTNEGKPPALGNHQIRALLEAPSLAPRRDRAYPYLAGGLGASPGSPQSVAVPAFARSIDLLFGFLRSRSDRRA